MSCCLPQACDDDKIAGTAHNKELQYRKKHMNMNHHQPPLLDIEPAKCLLCMLHCQMSITRSLFNHGIMELCTEDGQIERLNTALLKIGVNVK